MTGQTSDTQYWVAFNRIAGVGRARYRLLGERLAGGNPDASSFLAKHGRVFPDRKSVV